MDDTTKAKKLNIPGPGTYEDPTKMPATGSYPTSEFSNSKSSRINTGRRFKPQLTLGPGPGTYEEMGNIGKSVHTCTNFKSPKIKNIGTTEKRPEWSTHSRFATPGPGTYRPPSDFGYLDKIGQKDFNGSVM